MAGLMMRTAGWLLIVTAGLIAGGCNAAGYVAYAVAGDSPIKVTAEYYGLANQTVAVLVNADMSILYEHPYVQLEVCQAVSDLIAANVPGVQVIQPREIVEYQTRNIYWSTTPYSHLGQALGTTRIVTVDVHEYRTHEPGNAVMLRGVISARIEVAEIDGPTPNNPVYANMAEVAYPPDRPEGVPEGDVETIRKGTLDLFALAAAGKFYDHSEPRQQ